MALVTAVIIDRHVYFAVNSPAAKTGGAEESAADFVNTLGLPGDPLTAQRLTDMANAVGEHTVVSRTGGAPTFALGMSQIMTDLFGNAEMQAFWYHFAIMFEGLFILTAIDAGTRVARFMMSDTLGYIPGLGRFKDPTWKVGGWISTLLVCVLWGSILIMGVTDPLGGINVLFPLFGIANQLLAAIALTLVTTILVKKGLHKWVWVSLVPLVWDLVVTLTASWQKIFHSDPAIGYFAQHAKFRDAKNQGLTEFGNAKSPEAIDAVITNTMIQGVLSVIFAVLVIVVVIAALVTCIRAVQTRAAGGVVETSEEPGHASQSFVPRGMVATKEEKEVAALLGAGSPAARKADA